jgi:arginine kinase
MSKDGTCHPQWTNKSESRFENRMVEVFESFGLPGKYHSLTPGHKNFISELEADKLRDHHFLFNDMTTDNHLTSSGVASDWPHGEESGSAKMKPR